MSNQKNWLDTMRRSWPLPFLLLATLVLFGCGSDPETPSDTVEAVSQETAAPPPVVPQPPEDIEPEETETQDEPRQTTTNRAPADVPNPDTVPWVAGSRSLIEGLQGGKYQAYLPSVVENVQQALQQQGYYNGEADGVLDNATIHALGEYQKENKLMYCGIPTPRTRDSLLGGSLSQEPAT